MSVQVKAKKDSLSSWLTLSSVRPSYADIMQMFSGSCKLVGEGKVGERAAFFQNEIYTD